MIVRGNKQWRTADPRLPCRVALLIRSRLARLPSCDRFPLSPGATMIPRINFITSSAVIAALCTTACGDGSTSPTQAVPPSIPRFSGGSSGGGGGGTPAPSPTSVVGYSNLGASDSVSTLIGWGLIGLLQTPAGFFADVAERFAPTTSGTIASIRLAVQQTGTGGNGGYSVLVYADNSSAPDSTSCSTGACQGTTLGTLIGTFQGRTIRQVFGATTAGLSTIAVSNGPRLQAGPNFWIKVCRHRRRGSRGA